ncbi:hypothetical protein [Streptococcus thoraltensis]|uniref:hypothetical protein n=1 Tax=Streptococcus thoraltensis TaxID=55085 RepID=UPI001F5794A9|nr:hypothetical protein [Streptococcus thoraltensis]
MSKKVWKKIEKYFLIFLICFGVVNILTVFGVIGLIFYGLNDTMEVPYEINSKRIPAIYKKAGFKGKISDLENRSNPHNQRISYTYTEGAGKNKETYHFYFGIDRSKKEPKYSLHDIVDLYTGHYSESYEINRDRALFSEFFDTALFKNKKMNSYQSQLKKSLEETGLKNVEVGMSEEAFEFSDVDNSLLNKELKNDLDIVNKNGEKPLLGINTLDPFNYLKIGVTPLYISTDTDISYFVDYAKKVDKSKLKPGYYVVNENKSSYCSKYLLNEKLEWENITPDD